jgi:mono/diheme cytochrome c family protein
MFKLIRISAFRGLVRQLSQLVAATLALSSITLTSPGVGRAQNDAEKLYKIHCVLCHAPDGSGSAPTGKALKAEDLRSELIEKKTDAELAAAITNGKGNGQIAQLVAYIRALPKK